MLFVIHGHFDLINISQAEHVSPLFIYRPLGVKAWEKDTLRTRSSAVNSIYSSVSFIHSREKVRKPPHPPSLCHKGREKTVNTFSLIQASECFSYLNIASRGIRCRGKTHCT